MKQINRTPLAAIVALTLAPGLVTAGTLGATSSDTMGVSLNKDTQVRVSRVDDIDFTAISSVPAEGVEQSDPICIFSNSGAFELTLTSQNGATEFSMTNGTTDLAYTVSIEQPAGGLGGFLSGTLGLGTDQEAQSGTPIGGLESSSDETCTGGDNLTVTVAIAQTDFQSVPAGSYTDTMAVFVRPE